MNFPVFVENENKAVALAIKWIDEVMRIHVSSTLRVATGVGAGILYNGELLKGKYFNSGEIGYITVQYDGPLCNCGNKGCLELMISDRGVVDKVKEVFISAETGSEIKLCLKGESI